MFSDAIILALGLSMDSFAVSIAIGAGIRNKKELNSKALSAGAYFGAFQFAMPLVGYALGIAAFGIISGIDHWIAFGLLSFLGIKAVLSALKNKKGVCGISSDKDMLALSIATSIDALAAGITLAFLQVPVLLSCAIIGAVTFAVSYAGVIGGKKFCAIVENKAQVAGGLVLIALGIKILIEHLFFHA